MAETKICVRCGEERTKFFFVSSENPDVCGHCRDELRSPTIVAAQDAPVAEAEPVTDDNTCTECGRGNDHTARYCRDCNFTYSRVFLECVNDDWNARHPVGV